MSPKQGKPTSAPATKPVKVPVPDPVQVPILPSLFESPRQFQVRSDTEVAALSSASGILSFLGARAGELVRGAGGAGLQWVSVELLKAFGLGIAADVERIKELLETVLDTERQILRQLTGLLREVQFQHLITRGFDAVERITNIYQQLQDLSLVENEQERMREAARINQAILDPNLGVALNLKSINDVLLGKDQLGESDPLIPQFAERWLPVYLRKQLDADVPLSTYPGQLDAWLHGLFLVQYMGVSALANARVANGDFDSLKTALDRAITNMQTQRDLLDEAIPEFTRTLPETAEDGRRYVIRKVDYDTGQRVTSRVLYGSPTDLASELNFSLQFRDRNEGNQDEEWFFERSAGQPDPFILREVSRANYVTIDSANTVNQLKVAGVSQARPLRIAMARTQDPGIGTNARLRDRFVPVLAVVGVGYMTLYQYGTRDLTFAGEHADNAVRVQIDVVEA